MKPEPKAPAQILAIDDEEDLLGILRTALNGAGYRVATAARGQDGLTYYEQQWRDIDLVLLDYLMPDMQGDLVFECLQRVNPDVRVLLLTACDDHVGHGMFNKGLRGLITKPFYLDDLLQRVRDELEAP